MKIATIKSSGGWAFLALFGVSSLAALFVATSATFLPSPAYAQVPSDSELRQTAATTLPCRDDEGDDLQNCVDGWVAGYKDPKGDGDACLSKGDEFSRGFALCYKGYQAGQEARKAADSTPSGTLTDTQIRQLAASSSACKSLSGTKKTDCITGYVAGYKGKNNNVCTSNAVKNSRECQNGYNAGWDKNGKNLDVNNNPFDSSGAVTNNDSAAGEDEDSCDAKLLSPLSWIICPVVDGTNKVVDAMENVINSLLEVDTSPIFDTSDTESSGYAYKKAWSSFRTIALGIVFIAALVVIIGSAFGYEILDAYTIRKTLPRVLIAIVFITLSWSVLEFLIMLTNDVGNGMRTLIYAPFSEMENFQFSANAMALSTLVLGAGVLALGPLGVLSFGLTAAVAVFIAFIVLVVRELLIIFLVLLAPVAIACMILPNTRRVWDLWQKALITMLVVFPIIAGMIAVGRVFAITTYANGSSNALEEIIAFLAYIAPYFLLFFAFKLAGGLMGALANLAGNSSQGFSRGLQGYRQRKMGENFGAMKAGNRFKGSSMPARAFNRTSAGIANTANAGVTPWKWRSRMQGAATTRDSAIMAEYMEKSAAFSSIKNNDDYLQATMKNMGGGDTEDDWRRYLSTHGYQGRSLEQGVALIRAAKRDTSDAVFKQSATLANFSTGTGWKEGGEVDAMESINEAAGGNRDIAARLLAQGRSEAARAGRLDLGGSGFGTQIRELENMHAAEAAYGKDSEQYKAAKLKARDSVQENALFVKGAGDLIRARGDAVKRLAPAVVRKIQAAERKVSTAQGPAAQAAAKRELLQEYAAAAATHAQMSYAAPENARIWADTVMEAKLGAGGPSIQERITQLQNAGDPEATRIFQQTHSDYEARMNSRMQGGREGDENLTAAELEVELRRRAEEDRRARES